MDRRQKKTRKAIFDAFAALLEQKNYEKITVQEIIDKADVGRTTFYAHFETKDCLLQEMCADIFGHVFSEHLHAESTHDFSNKEYTLTEQITHILYHLRDSRAEILRLLSGESSEIFLNYMKPYLVRVLDPLIREEVSGIPASYQRRMFSDSFAGTIKWWSDEKMQHTPEEVAGYYVTVITQGLLKPDGI